MFNWKTHYFPIFNSYISHNQRVNLHFPIVFYGFPAWAWLWVQDESGKMVEDFWGPSVKMVGESDFLRSLQSFDKDRAPSTGRIRALSTGRPGRCARGTARSLW